MPFDRATLPRDPDRLIEIIMALQDRNVDARGVWPAVGETLH
jgi:hypothetical protein